MWFTNACTCKAKRRNREATDVPMAQIPPPGGGGHSSSRAGLRAEAFDTTAPPVGQGKARTQHTNISNRRQGSTIEIPHLDKFKLDKSILDESNLEVAMLR